MKKQNVTTKIRTTRKGNLAIPMVLATGFIIAMASMCAKGYVADSDPMAQPKKVPVIAPAVIETKADKSTVTLETSKIHINKMQYGIKNIMALNQG